MHMIFHVFNSLHFLCDMYRHRDYLEDGLRSVTMERDSVRELMMWCMDHSESADEVIKTLVTSAKTTTTRVNCGIRAYVCIIVSGMIHERSLVPMFP